MKFFLKVNRIIVRMQAITLSLSIIAMAAVLIINVLCRQFLGFSLSFAEEVGQNLLVIVTFTGVSYCAAWGKHINMLAIFNIMPKGARKLAATAIAGITSVVMFTLSYAALNYMLMVKTIGRVTTALQFPIWIIIMIVAFGFLFAGVQYLIILLQNFTHKEVFMTIYDSYEIKE